MTPEKTSPGIGEYPVMAVVSGDVDGYRACAVGEKSQQAMDLLLIAVANGQLDIVRHLLQTGTPASEQTLVVAAENGRLDVVRYLHEVAGINGPVKQEAVRAAVRANQLSIVLYLHEQGADLSSCADLLTVLAHTRSAESLITYLCKHNVMPDGNQLIALLNAIRTGTYATVKKEINDIHLGTYSGILAEAAAERGDPGILILLHQSGCNVFANNQSALVTAAARGHVAVIRYLHENGADLQANNNEALRIAAENGELHAVAFLAERGADIRCIDSEVLERIRFNGQLRTFNYLTDSGLDAIMPHRPAIAAMLEELRGAKSVYGPSKLWEYFNDINLEQLRRGGIQNFKRSINQNYFNFLPYSLLDPQLLKLAGWWMSHPTLTPFKAKAFDPDVLPKDGRLLAMDRRVFTLAHRYRILSWLTRKTGIDAGRKAQLGLYRILLSMLWDYACAHDRLGLTNRLSEPRIGSPIDFYVDSRLISQDLAHSILECNSILGEIARDDLPRPMRIAEVGAGYGRLGYVLMKAVECQYVVFDIPPGLFVSQWYLAETFPEKRIFRFRHFESFEDIAEELSQADIAFFSPNQIENFPAGYFDITVNISSLHELRPDQIDNMLDQIFRITRRNVYLKQYKEYINPYDGLRLLEDSYKVAPGWRHRYYRDDGVDARFFETLIEREVNDFSDPAPQWPTRAGSANAPTVSILLANYNHGRYLHTALTGICNQTRPATEIIIVDDGSTDNSIAIVEDFARRYPSIRLLCNGRNRGQHYSIQRALLAARGDYVVWAASDDLLLPRFIERSMDVLQSNPQAGLCFSRLAVFVDGSTETRHYTGQNQGIAFEYGETARFISPEEFVHTLRRHYLWMSGNTVVAKRHAMLEIGGIEQKLRWHGDWFAFYVVALRYGACVIPETLAVMRERRDTYSRTGMENPREQTAVLKSMLDTVKSPNYRDLLPIFEDCPSLLGLFGRRMLFTVLRNPQHWNFAWGLCRSLIPNYLRREYGKLLQKLSSRRQQFRLSLQDKLRKILGR